MEAKKIIHHANSRGHADYGWLKTYHTFSFSNYYNPNRINFGALRVLNDDTIEGGTGFDTHPHKNMEIITIPLIGALEHKDSLGNASVIKQGDIQVMSAGTGVYHSEFNHHKDKSGQFLQIWVLPDKENATPRYGQISLNREDRHNKFQQIVTPNPSFESIWIHQQAWIHLGNFDAGKRANYQLKKEENGVYLFIISGSAKINGEILSTRDGMGITDTENISIEADSKAEILVIEVPINL